MGGDDPPAVEKVLYLLSKDLSERVLQRMRSLVAHEHASVRAGAARALGVNGDDQDLQAICELLTDGTERVRKSAVIGVSICVDDEEGGSKAFKSGVFLSVAEALRRSGRDFYGGTAELLVQLNRKRALEFLQSGEVLGPEVGALRHVLGVLRDETIEVPTNTLLALLPRLDGWGDSAGEYDDPRSPLIEMLGEIDDPRVESMLERYSTCSNPYTAANAAEARCARLGLDPDAVAYEAVGADPTSGCIEHQTYCLAMGYSYQINNGGFRQFYSNASGRWAADTAQALKVIGAPKNAELLERASAEFGPAGPSVDEDDRWAALDRMALGPGEDFVLGSYDAAAYSYVFEEPIVALVHLYVLKHPDPFKDRKPHQRLFKRWFGKKP